MSALEQINELHRRVGESIIGQEEVVNRLIIGLLANGNLLLEGLLGLAKTRAVKSLAKNLDAGMSRIQFTPDLLPSDVTGTEMYQSEGGKGIFQFQPGPIFSNIILADEINRSPAKVQAALLEAMEERQVTVAGAGVYLFSKTRQRRKHTNKFEWDVQSGLGYQFLKLISTAAGAENPQNDGFALFRTHWKLEFLNDNVELTLDRRSNLVYTSFGRTNHTGMAEVSVEITDMFSFVTSFLYLRTRDPQPRSDATVPAKNDYQIVVSLAITIN